MGLQPPSAGRGQSCSDRGRPTPVRSKHRGYAVRWPVLDSAICALGGLGQSFKVAAASTSTHVSRGEARALLQKLMC